MATYSGKIKPPYSDQTSGLTAPSLAEKLRKMIMFIFGALVLGGIIFGIGYIFEISWLQYTGYIVAGLLALLGIKTGFSAKISECPYCGSVVGKGDDVITLNDEKEQIECSNCFEWLISDQGTVRAFTKKDAEEKLKEEREIDNEYQPTYTAPVFTDGVWPKECIVCGKNVTHYDEAKKTKLKLSKLLTGTISINKSSISNIPYCKDHSDAVALKVEDDFLRIVFNDYDTRRRYISLNSGLKPVKAK